MGKKLLVILGIAALAGFVFRDQIIAGALALGGKLNVIKEDLGWNDSEDDDEGFPQPTRKEN